MYKNAPTVQWLKIYLCNNLNIFKTYKLMKEFAKLRIPSCFYAIELRTKLTARRTFVRRRALVLCEIRIILRFVRSALFFYIPSCLFYSPFKIILRLQN